MIYGEGREFNICVVVPDFEVLTKYAEKNGLPTDQQALVADETVRKMISDRIVEILKGKFGNYEIPRKFVFVAEDFTLESGMLTQTLKLKRRAVIEKFNEQIEEQYQ